MAVYLGTMRICTAVQSNNSEDKEKYVVHMPPEKVFMAAESNATCTSTETYSFNTLKYLDYIVKATTGNPYGNENFGIYKDDNNYIQTVSNGYSKNFVIKINGTTLLTQTISGYVDNITGYTDLHAHFDFIRKIFVVEVMSANTANPVEKARIDFSAYDISGLTDFKIIANIGRYAANVFSESVYVNNLTSYKSLLTQHYNVNSYNALTTFNNSRRCVSPSSLYLGNTTTTITNTHKIATINRAGGYYSIGSYGSWSGTVGLNLVKLRVYDVNTAPVFNNGAGNRGLMFFNYDTGKYVGAAGFTPTENVWYLFVINMGSSINYTVNYSVNLKGDCKIEAEAVAIMMPQSINLCAETYNGSYFTGSVPFKVGNVTFTTPSFATNQSGRAVPKGALSYASNGGISMYNGTAWKAIAS